ncbi:MAG TPA: formate dehydrogenase accessory protein FdhE [Acidisphaera sp.]|nr:formate dehydrogenase accessory protein FdhE [Acidisphaera sp.]
MTDRKQDRPQDTGSRFDQVSRGGIGEPDFARLPDPSRLFATRAARFAALAADNALGPYLTFLVRIADAQHRAVGALPPLPPPDQDRIAQRLSHGMPLLSKDDLAGDDDFARALDWVCHALYVSAAPEPAVAALSRLAEMPWPERLTLANAAFDGSYPAEQLGECLYVAAALQVHLARRAAQLDQASLRPLEAAVCPACGSMPVASVVVGWAKADNARYCACALCGTMWNYVRIKCTSCESTADLTYYTIEEQSKDHAVEACGICRTYIKHLHQERDTRIEPLADDIGSFGLDLLVREKGFERGAVNPFMVTP